MYILQNYVTEHEYTYNIVILRAIAGSISDHDKAYMYIINIQTYKYLHILCFNLFVSVCISIYNILWTYFHFRTLRTNRCFKLLLSIVMYNKLYNQN